MSGSSLGGEGVWGSSYEIRLKKDGAVFVWGSPSRRLLKGSVDLEARLDPRELVFVARSLRLPAVDGRILVGSLDLYNRLLIYACVRPFVRGVEGERQLRRVVFGMSGLDAHYWASAFRELWWRYGRRRMLWSTIRAFKLFFGLG